MAELVGRAMRETPENRRLLVIVCGDMQYRAAEIENLADQDDFSRALGWEKLRGWDLLRVKRPQAIGGPEGEVPG
jgi:hypothetical protein